MKVTKISPVSICAGAVIGGIILYFLNAPAVDIMLGVGATMLVAMVFAFWK